MNQEGSGKKADFIPHNFDPEIVTSLDKRSTTPDIQIAQQMSSITQFHNALMFQ